MRSFILCLFLSNLALAQSPRGVMVVLANDRGTAQSLSEQLIAARDRAHLSENQLQVRRILAQGWSPARFRELGLSPADLPLEGLARYSGSGRFLGLVGYPDFVERKVQDAASSGDRLVRRWAEANSISVQPPQPLIRAVTVLPEIKEPLPIGAELLVTVQAESGGTLLINSSSNRSLTLPEVGGGLYQGFYKVNKEEKGDIALIAHYSNAQGASEDKPVGHFQAIGWSSPQIRSVEPTGNDIYRVSGTAPPGALVKVKCHIDMGRFLFIGYTDYDHEWNVKANDQGQFAFNMDLNQAETRRSGMDLEAKFTLSAQNPDNEQERSEETAYTATVRMTYSARMYPAYYYGSSWPGYRTGFSFGLGYPGYYGRFGRFGPWW